MEERASQLELAIGRLPYYELGRLHYVANSLLRQSGNELGYNADDLIQEALLKLLSGERPWNVEIPFYPFMCGCMKSIVWNWRKRHRTVSLDDDDTFRDEDGRPREIASSANVDREVSARI